MRERHKFERQLAPLPWSKEEQAKALEMRNAGRNAREIAGVIGRTRNAVIGWLSRQGVPSEAKAHRGKDKQPRKPTTPKGPQRFADALPEAPHVPRAPSSGLFKARKPNRKPTPKPAGWRGIYGAPDTDEQRFEPHVPLVFDDPPPTMRLRDATPMACRWIAGDPHRDETMICGRESVGKSYCALHHGVVYTRTPVKPKRKEAA